MLESLKIKLNRPNKAVIYFLLSLGTSVVSSTGVSRSIDWKSDWGLLERSGFEMSRYMFNRDPYVPEIGPTEWTGRLSMDMDIRLFPFLRWNNTVHTSGNSSSVKHVGWEFEAVIDIFDKVQPFYYHHSQHVMEYARPSRSFPVVDRYGLRFNWYMRETK